MRGGPAEGGASSPATCSASGNPPAASRLARIRAGSATSRVSMSTAQDAADPVRWSRSLSGAHSACHAPAARWCSCSAAAARMASSPGTCLVQPSTAMAATGFCLCGMADEPPRPSPPRSWISATSDWASSVTSRAILPSTPLTPAHAAPISMIRSRSVCQGSVGTARPSSAASRAATPGPASPSAASVPAAPPNCTASRLAATRASAATCLVQAGQPAGRDQPEGDRYGLLQQRAADHQRVPVRTGQAGRGRGRRGQVGTDRGQRLPGQQHGRGVDDVLAGRTLVHGGRGVRRHQPGQITGQRGHRVAGKRRLLAQPGQVERSARAAAVTAAPAPRAASPAASSARASAASVSSIACSQAWPDVSTWPRLNTPSKSPRESAPPALRLVRQEILPAAGWRLPAPARRSSRTGVPAGTQRPALPSGSVRTTER